jgi:hypothetical protein
MGQVKPQWIDPLPPREGCRAGTIRRLGLFILFGMAALLSLGCPDTEIRTYDAPKSDVRLLAAILPHGDDVWFFKLVGPAKEFADKMEAFETFLRSVGFSGKGDLPIEWSAPKDWRRGPVSKMRYATFLLGSEEQPLELTVTQLPKKASSVKRNVNRWRAQIGLRPMYVDELGEVTKSIELPAGPATWVDITSRTPDLGGDMQPAHKDAQYVRPAGWQKMPKPPEFAFAGFQLSEGGETVTISLSPLEFQGGGLLENVNRWRRQLGLEEWDEERQVDKDVRPVEVDGEPAYFLDLTGKEVAGKPPQRIIGAIVEMQNLTWFIKMIGPPGLVGRQKDTFSTFLQSVRFDIGAGENDG